jgi:thiamine pyrophosphokinase
VLKHYVGFIGPHLSVTGGKRLITSPQIPDVIHGDLDSLLPKVEEFYRSSGSQIIRDPDQETTDFMKCLKLISTRTGEIIRGSPQKLDVVALGGLGGRVDHGLSQLHHLYMAGEDTSLHIERIILLTPESITFLLHKGHNKIYTPHSKGLLAKNVGIIPVGRPAVISTKGLEWDVSDWTTEFGGRISTSNHVKSDIIEVETTERVVFTIELADS